MKIVALILSPPLPVFAAAAYQEFPGIAAPDGPGWVAVFLLGAWVVLWFLNQIGKLPGQGGRSPGDVVMKLPEQRGRQFDEIHHIVTREDPDKPGYAMVWSSRAERDALQKTMHAVQKTLDSHERLVGVNISTLEAIQRSLATLHAKMDALAQERRA